MARSSKHKLAYVLATWFGCGRVPLAPGTAGTLGAVPLYLLLRPAGPAAVGLAALVLTAVGVWAASVVVADSGKKDPQQVVIDEVAGVLVTFTAASPNWQGTCAGIVLFRIFDQFKPWPARDFERKLRGGWGVVMDDIAAGLWGALVLTLLTRLGILP